MKKMIRFLALALAMAMLTACGGNAPAEDTTAPAHSLTGSMEELLNQVVEKRPVEFSGVVTTLDLTDTSDEGAWLVKNTTGLASADALAEAGVFEPMIGSIPFSLVMVRVAPDADPQTVAQEMLDGVDPVKWICVSADEVMAAGFGDVVMLIMVSTDYDITAQSFVDAFQTVAGDTLDFTLSR